MKVAIVAVLLGLGLSACVTTQNGSQLSNFLATVQQRTKQACGYLPSAQMVVAVNGTTNANVKTASEVASNICQLVK